MSIDWSKAPVGTIGRGTVGEFLPVWIGSDWYEHDRESGGRYFFADVGVPVTAWRRADVTNYLARPNESPAWTGTGLPPVGTVCECFIYDSMLKQWAWKTGELIYYNGNNEFAVKADGTLRWCDQFRPIRTPEQIAEEARSEAVRDMIITWKVPPVGSEFNFAYDRAAALYDAGYRKQPKEGA